MKIVHKTEYATVPNSLLSLPSLSMKAKGIYAYIQSKPIGWSFSKERIAKETSEGVDSLRSGMDELVNAGYLRINKLSTGRTELELMDKPSHEPSLEKPTVGKSHSGKNPQWENPTDKKEGVKRKKEYKENNNKIQTDILSEEIYCKYMENHLPKGLGNQAKLPATAKTYISYLLKTYDSPFLLSCIASYKEAIKKEYWMAPQYFFCHKEGKNVKHTNFFLNYAPVAGATAKPLTEEEKRKQEEEALAFF